MKLYTEEEVSSILKKVVIETINGMYDWVHKETIIVDKDTKIELDNTELTTKPNAEHLNTYVYERLEKLGITFTEGGKL